MRLRKTLPADIEQIIASGDVEAVARAVARCEIGAYLRGSAYEPRLMHFPASEEITDFLLARGEDINSRDRYQRTPIHARVRSRCLDQIPLLIARGGDINARDTSDQTALFGVVERFPVADVSRMIAWGADPLVVADSRVYGKATLVENVVAWHNFLDTPRALAVIRLLLSVGAPVGERVPTALRSMDRMRCTFITHGLPDHLSQSRIDEASAALSELCALFGVEQREAQRAPVVGERLELDPSVPALRQYGELWDLLVPDSGQCRTLQGEVIRIAGESVTKCTTTAESTGIALLGSCWTSICVLSPPVFRCHPTLSPAPRPPSPPSSPVRCPTRPSTRSRSWRWRGCA